MFEPGGDLKVGDVILVMSPISPEETGRSGGGGGVLETDPGKDGRVRVV